MSAVLNAVATLFSTFFHNGAGTQADPYGMIQSVVKLVEGNDFLLIGLAIMLSSLAISYLARLIHNT